MPWHLCGTLVQRQRRSSGRGRLPVGVGGRDRVDHAFVAAAATADRAHFFAHNLANVDHLALDVREHHVRAPRAHRRLDAPAQPRRPARDPHTLHHALSGARRVPIVTWTLHHAPVQVVREVSVELWVFQRRRSHRPAFRFAAVGHNDSRPPLIDRIILLLNDTTMRVGSVLKVGSTAVISWRIIRIYNIVVVCVYSVDNGRHACRHGRRAHIRPNSIWH